MRYSAASIVPRLFDSATNLMELSRARIFLHNDLSISTVNNISIISLFYWENKNSVTKAWHLSLHRATLSHRDIVENKSESVPRSDVNGLL